MTSACLLLKAPRPGLVKTRLARDLGFPQATAIYRALVERQLRAIPPSWETAVHYTPTDAAAEFTEWLDPQHWQKIVFCPQSEGNLGDRLRSASEREFSRGAEKLLLLGGDCPGLDHAYLSEAAQKLDDHDLVLGPALDGGYVLLGCKKTHPGLFTQIAWSTNQVLRQTLAAANTLKLRTTRLPALEDIDDLASCRSFFGEEFPGSESGPR